MGEVGEGGSGWVKMDVDEKAKGKDVPPSPTPMDVEFVPVVAVRDRYAMIISEAHQLAALGRKSARSYDMVIKGMEDLYLTTRDALAKKPLTVGRPNVGLDDGTSAGPSNPRKTTTKGRKEYKRKKSATEK